MPPLEDARRQRADAEARGVALRQLAHQCLLHRIPVRRRDTDDAVVVNDVDDRPVGELVHAKAGERTEDVLVVERRRHQRRRFAQDVRPPAGGFGLDAAFVLPFEQEGVLERDGDLGGDELQRHEPVGGEHARGQLVLEVEQRHDTALPADREAEERARTRGREVRIRGEPPGIGGGVIEHHALVRARDVVKDRRGHAARRRARGRLCRLARVLVRRERLLGRDLELAVAHPNEARPSRAALLDDDLQERPNELFTPHDAGDGLRGLDHRQEVQLIRGSRRELVAPIGESRQRRPARLLAEAGVEAGELLQTFPSAPQRR